jgi:dipeptidyl aminopeptidase/acylaminoacyl peptidase
MPRIKQSKLLLIASLAWALPLSGQGKKTVEPADLANVKQVSDSQISPDGKLVAYVVEIPVPGGTPKNIHIWLAPADRSGRAVPFVFSGGKDTNPRWSPDGKWLAFLSDRKNPLDEPNRSPFHFSLAGVKGRTDLEPPSPTEAGKEKGMQLWLISLDGGEAVPLTDIAGGITSFAWSHDGRYIAFVRSDGDTKQEREGKKKKYDEIVVDHDYKYARLWIYDVARHQARLLTTADMNIDDFDWSPDGARIVARVSPTPRTDDYWRVSKIVILNSATGEVEKTIEERAGYSGPRWSPDGRRIAFSEMTPRAMTDVHLIYDLDTGKKLVIEDSFPGTVEQMTWMPDGKSLLAQGIRLARRLILKVDAATGKAVTLPGTSMAADYDSSISVSKDGQTIAFVGNTPVEPDEVWIYAHDRAAVLTDTNPQVRDWSLGTEREIEWKSSKDGRTIFGVVDFPPGYQKGERYKTIVHAHGGPEEAWTIGWHGSWYNYDLLLASHGYVVLLPDPRGSDGAGPAYTEANYQDWGDGDYQDIMDGVDYLIAQGIADPHRLGVTGWSYGGYMTSWIVTQTNRFKAAVEGAGITDLFSMATTTDISPSYERGYWGRLATHRALYDQHSAVRYLQNVHTPLLILGGEADVRVPISQGEEFYNGLRFLGRDVEMVRYPREPHIFTEPAHQIDSLERILAWFDSHLGK